jgi:hypothetical protein
MELHGGKGKDQRVWQPVAFAVAAAELRPHADAYRSELGVTYTLGVRDSALVFKGTGSPDVTIAPFSKDVFVGDWVGIVKFTRDARHSRRPRR